MNIVTSDSKIWNLESVWSDITLAFYQKLPVVINLNDEGPDIAELDDGKFLSYLKTLAAKYNYNLSDVTLETKNLVQTCPDIKLKITSPFYSINFAPYEIGPDLAKKKIDKHFACFVYRSNGPRLYLGQYLFDQHKEKSILRFHWDNTTEVHAHNIGLEYLINRFGFKDVSEQARFLANCPIIDKKISIDTGMSQNAAEQLMANDQKDFLKSYQSFFVEIVCETCFSGNVFFPSEKIWRPMFLRTPFVVQGPKGFLKNLKKLGFMTFDRWWSESYNEDWPGIDSLESITHVLDYIGSMDTGQLQSLYEEMLPVLEHNYHVVRSLKTNDVLRDFYDV